MHFTQLQSRSMCCYYGIFHGRCDSPAGRNVLHCMNRYTATLSDVLSPKFESLESMAQKTFLFNMNNRLICCASALICDIVFTLPDYRAKHVMLARYCYRKSSVRLSVRL